ncbi:glycosyltransferase family 2 protein [Mucilaginibacter sp. CSA2-8R]|uniref:glycosyltransferase family 2 protein n=1 Tax=Mucilaginibacter sp. CSA2-8R TaxID=3141542 RepID=UPI00315DACD4
MYKAVALILLNWNTPEHTTNCIRSVLKYCNTDIFDIIITDNGSTDGSLAILRETFPELIYIDNKENLGFAEGNNRALQHSIAQGYTYSLVMNTDTLVDEDIVSKLSFHLQKHPAVAAVQPAIYWMHKPDTIWNGEGRFNKVLGTTISDTTTPIQAATNLFYVAEWLTGCCMMLKNEALQKSGLFNKLFFLYYEDVDLSYRLRKEGYVLHYLPSCKMYHEAGVSAKVSAPKKEGQLSPVIHYYISRNHLWFIRQYGVPALLPVNFVYNGLYYFALWVYFLVRRRNTKATLLLKGLREGLFTPKEVIWSKNNLHL